MKTEATLENLAVFISSNWPVMPLSVIILCSKHLNKKYSTEHTVLCFHGGDLTLILVFCSIFIEAFHGLVSQLAGASDWHEKGDCVYRALL